MTLVKCPACGHDVSDQAQSCPNCGQPLHVSQTKTVLTMPVEDSIQTIQRTKKKWKKAKLFAIAFFILGLLCMGNNLLGLGIALCVLAIITGIIASIGAWWSTG